MFTYNTTREPIILKDYGRYIQKLIQHIASIDKTEEQTLYITQLLPILNNIKAQKKQNDVQQLWSDAYIISNYQLKIQSPFPLPEKTPIQHIDARLKSEINPNKFKCCGKNMTKLVCALMSSIEEQPQAKEIIITLAKVIQQIHKKTKTSTTVLPHIEEIANKKIPFPHSDIEQHLLPKHYQYYDKHNTN